MKVLITGGMGVIGAEASRRFVREGHRPIIFARHRDEWLIRDILEEVDVELGDVLDMPRLLDVIKLHRVTHIVHAAAFVGAVSAANPALSVQVNVMGMANVLEAARAFDVARVVYTSAKGVYGPVLGEYGAPTYKPVPEDLPKNPKRIYDSAKLMAEQVGLYYQAHMGVDVVVLRFATTYGPGKTARHGKMGVTSQIVENPFNGLAFRLAQGGDEKDDFIYNKDSALDLSRLHGGNYARKGPSYRDFRAPCARDVKNKGRGAGLAAARFNAQAPAAGAALGLLAAVEDPTTEGPDSMSAPCIYINPSAPEHIRRMMDEVFP